MPYFMRLTSDGIGLHAGRIPRPGSPASHGCIRMPNKVATLLFERVNLGTKVTITGNGPNYGDYVERQRRARAAEKALAAKKAAQAAKTVVKAEPASQTKPATQAKSTNQAGSFTQANPVAQTAPAPPQAAPAPPQAAPAPPQAAPAPPQAAPEIHVVDNP